MHPETRNGLGGEWEPTRPAINGIDLVSFHPAQGSSHGTEYGTDKTRPPIEGPEY